MNVTTRPSFLFLDKDRLTFPMKNMMHKQCMNNECNVLMEKRETRLRDWRLVCPFPDGISREKERKKERERIPWNWRRHKVRSLGLRLVNVLLAQWTPIFNVLRPTLSRHALSMQMTAGAVLLLVEKNYSII